MNRTLREIDEKPQPKPDDVPAVAKHRQALAEKYEGLAAEVSKLKLSEPALIERAKRYSGLATAASVSLRAGVKALNDRDPKAAEQSQKEFDAVAKQEAALVGEINQMCLGDGSH